MTKIEVLKELDALIELTNEGGKMTIKNIRAWVESKNEAQPVVELPAIEAPVPVKRAVKKVVKRK